MQYSAMSEVPNSISHSDQMALRVLPQSNLQGDGWKLVGRLSDIPALPALVRTAALAPETRADEASNASRAILHGPLRHLFAAWKMAAFLGNARLVKGDSIDLARDW